MGKLLRRAEAAKKIGVTKQTIANWLNSGFIPAQRNGNYDYIDESALMLLSPSLTELEAINTSIKNTIEDRNDALKELKSQIDNIRAELKIIPLIRGSVGRTDFYLSIVDMLGESTEITNVARDILKELLNGSTYDEIGKYHGLTGERIRQIVYKTIRRAKYLIDYRFIENENKELEAEVKKLKAIISHETLKKNNSVFNLLTQPVSNYKMSKRAQNGLKYNGIDTIGDLVKLPLDKVSALRGVGRKSLHEYISLCDELGLHFDYKIE